jgi:uncharacterized protein
MSGVFADTGYWIALVYPRDQWHQTALAFSRNITENNVRVFTSEMVLVEFANFFSRSDRQLRDRVANFMVYVKSQRNITIVPQSSEQFDQAVQLFSERTDKQWSLTDCSSFLLMAKLNITDALAYDKHFEQAGFRALLKQR